MKARSVLECGSPLPLWLKRTTKHDADDAHSSATGHRTRFGLLRHDGAFPARWELSAALPQRGPQEKRGHAPAIQIASGSQPGQPTKAAAEQSARGLAQSKTWRSLPALLACLALGLLTPLLFAEPLTGGSFALEGGPVTGGGAAAGGTFAVDASAGETAAGPLSGGTFEVTGGLIGVAVVPGDIALDFTTTDGQVTLTWSADATDYVLEFTPMISAVIDWQPVTPAPAGGTFTTPFNQPLRFFRLHRR